VSRTPGEPPTRAGAGRGLAAFVAAGRDDFAARFWDRAPLLSPGDALPGMDHGFGSQAVDELLSRRALRTPFLRMAKDGATLDPRTFTLGGGVGAAVSDQVSEDRVLALFADGATIVLQGLHRAWGPVQDLAQDLAEDLGHPVQVNAYITPPQNRGFDDHYDVHDVFVVQVSGEKHWQVRPPVLDAPLRNQPWTDHREAVRAAARDEPVVDAVLRPGDVLYLPRGWLHSATALGGTSIHLTFGIHVWTGRQLADDLVRAAAHHLDSDPELRAALPVGADALDGNTPPVARKAVREALERALDAVTDDELAEVRATRVRSAQRAEPLGVLAQHDAARRHAGPWRPRAHLAARWEGDVLVTRVGRVQVDPDQRDHVAAVLEGCGSAEALEPSTRRTLALAGVIVPDPGPRTGSDG
jgi:lysine-specific demethylase/histidyl-hydroxylase NO66